MAADPIDDDEFTLILLGIAAFPLLSAAVGTAWSQGSDWLVAHHLLVAASCEPLLPIPTMGGAGLDLGRVAVLLGLGLLLAAVMVLSLSSLTARKAPR